MLSVGIRWCSRATREESRWRGKGANRHNVKVNLLWLFTTFIYCVHAGSGEGKISINSLERTIRWREEEEERPWKDTDRCKKHKVTGMYQETHSFYYNHVILRCRTRKVWRKNRSSWRFFLMNVWSSKTRALLQCNTSKRNEIVTKRCLQDWRQAIQERRKHWPINWLVCWLLLLVTCVARMLVELLH